MSETTTETTEVDAETTEEAEADQVNPDDEASLGEAGKRALDRMKAERNEAKQALKALETQLSDAKQSQSQLDAILKAAGLKSDDEATDPAKITAELEESRKAAAENAAALVRYQTAVEKQVPSHLVKFVTGSTREEVEASIEEVVSAFAASKPTGPQPDPSQGEQGTPTSLDAQIAAAEKAGNTREVIRLKARKGMTATTN